MLPASMFETLEDRRLMSTTFLGTLGSAYAAIQVVSVTTNNGDVTTTRTGLQTPGGRLVLPGEPTIPGNPILPDEPMLAGWLTALVPGNLV